MLNFIVFAILRFKKNEFTMAQENIDFQHEANYGTMDTRELHSTYITENQQTESYVQSDSLNNNDLFQSQSYGESRFGELFVDIPSTSSSNPTGFWNQVPPSLDYNPFQSSFSSYNHVDIYDSQGQTNDSWSTYENSQSHKDKEDCDSN